MIQGSSGRHLQASGQLAELAAPVAPSKWFLFLLVATVAVATYFWPNSLPEMRYERVAMVNGEIWRALSAHLVHVSGAHLLLNIAGFALVCELLWGTLAVRHGIGLLFTAALAVSALLFWMHPGLVWYAGLSGALHGLWAGCALAGSLPATASGSAPAAPTGDSGSPRRWSEFRSICLAGLLLLAIKLALEFWHGAAAGTAQLIGAPVVTVSHTYGALAGLLYILIWRAIARLSP